MYWGHGPGWGWPGLIAAVVMMLLFWGGLIGLTLLIIHSVREWRTSGPARELPPSGDSVRDSRAEQILAERLASGELDESTYRRLREILRSR